MPVILSDQTAADKTVILWDNLLERVVVETTGAQSDNPGVNALNDSTFDYWGNSGSGITSMTNIGGSRLSASAFGVSGHNLATTGGKMFLRYSNDLVTFTDAILPYSPLTNDDLLFIFPVRSHTYWRVSFNGTGSYVSNVKLGQRLDFPCTPVVGYKPTHHSRKYTKYFNNSIEGHLLGNRVMSSGGTTTVEFPEIPRSFVDGPLLGFEDHYNRGRSFFYAGWPGGKPQDMAYAWADGEDAMIDVTYTGGDKLATVGFGMSLFYGR